MLMTDLFSLEGKFAVVTGGAGQLGGEIARSETARDLAAELAGFAVTTATRLRERRDRSCTLSLPPRRRTLSRNRCRRHG